MWLIAQQASYEPQSFRADLMVVWIILGVGVILLATVLFAVSFWLVLRHLRRNRELLHAERTKALEVGQPADFAHPDRSKERYGHNAFWIAFWVGAILPMAVVGSAASAMAQGQFPDIGFVIVVWISVTLISVAGVVGATIVMVSARRVAYESSRIAPRSSPQGHL
jgi:hypothetical protein